MSLSKARHVLACVFTVGAGIFAPVVSAQDVPNPSGPLTLGAAVDAALRFNPDLAASSYEISAAQARIVQANLRPNPVLSADVENFAGTGNLRTTRALETTLSLSQVLELGNKRGLRREAAEADLDLANVDQRVRELDVLAEVTRRFIAVVAAEERSHLAGDIVELAEQTLGAIDTRVTAGRSPEAERSRARIAVTRAHIELQQSESQLRASRAALVALWGATNPAFTGTRADLFGLRPVETFATLMDRVAQSPDFVRFTYEQRLRDAELRLAQVQRRPNLTVSAGARRLEIGDDLAFVAGVSLPLQVFDRNQGNIRQAQVRRNQTDAIREANLVRVRASLFGFHQELEAARLRVSTLRDEALPQAQTALDQTRTGYERGRFSFLELATAQEELFVVRQAAIDAAADFHRVLVEIERLTNNAVFASEP